MSSDIISLGTHLDDGGVRENRQESPHLPPELERVHDVVALSRGQLHQAHHSLKRPARLGNEEGNRYHVVDA